MADSFHSSQESDILPPEFKHLMTAEYAEIINTVQNEDDFEPVINEDSTLHVKPLFLQEGQQSFGVSQLDNPPMMVVAPMNPMPSPTGVMPTTDEYPGPYDFEIQIDGRSSGKNWVFSYELYKLFLNMNTTIHLGFKCEPVPHDLYVRALPVFCEVEAFQKPVVRCLHHRSLNDPQNEGLGDSTLVDHILRIDHSQAMYDYDETSGRRSVLVELGQPQAGTDWVTVAFKFMCKNSCISGMNRRPIEVIFTLEDGSQTVLGRRKMKVRICSCPKRDKLKEEEDLKSKHGNKMSLGKRAAVPQTKEDNQSAKLRKVDGFIQLPVLDLEALLDVTDYAQLRICKKIRLEKRQPTEEEEILLQNYKQILATYE